MDQRTQQKSTPRRNTGFPEPRRWPGQKYWIILITTIILLVACTMSLFVILLTETDGYSSSDVPQGSRPSGTTGERPTSKPQTNAETIPATSPSMSNYIATTSQFVQQIDGVIDSNNTILIEIGEDSCMSIAEKDADSTIYPASMTKVMSLLVACENLNSLSTKLTVTKEVADFAEHNDGSGFGLKVGEILTVKDLLYLTSYQSDTIAIITLAEHISGSEENFVELMNAKARELGLTNTNFSNCTGLHDANNYTTCREMAAIMTYALDNPLCRELLTSYQGYKLVTNMRSEEDKNIFYSTWYSGRFKDNPRLSTVVIKGGKTGYTDEAGVCLVTYAESKSTGKAYVNVIVGKPKGSGLSESISTSEVKKIYNNYAQ